MSALNFDLLTAVSVLEKPDGVIAFPTDTVYGLGCLVDHPEAVERIYRIKGREETKPLILLGYDRDAFRPFVKAIPQAAEALMSQHWPGALTIILTRSEALSTSITRGMGTVGIRIPDCRLYRDLLAMIPGGVMATTSANRSGIPPCVTAACVHNTFGDDVDYVLADDAGIQDEVASTVVAVNEDGSLRVLRTGRIVLD